MILRDAQPADRDAIDRVVSAAFGQAAEARLVHELDRAGDTVLALVAEVPGEIIGHVLLSRLSAPFPALALAPVSVAPAQQLRGIGSALIRAVIDRARAAGWAAIFVLGDPAYYRRFGFDAAAAAGFSTPYAGPHFMVLPLAPPLPASQGALAHAPAFAALG